MAGGATIFSKEGDGSVALTEKQKMFVQEYLVDLNATQAAVRAGYSQKRASEIGYQLLQKTTVQAAIHDAMEARQQRTEVTQDYVIDKLREIAEMRASDCPESDLKYGNKIKAIELLGKHVGAWERRESGPADEGSEDELSRSLRELAEGLKNDD